MLYALFLTFCFMAYDGSDVECVEQREAYDLKYSDCEDRAIAWAKKAGDVQDEEGRLLVGAVCRGY